MERSVVAVERLSARGLQPDRITRGLDSKLVFAGFRVVVSS